jgi:hypothetical protein
MIVPGPGREVPAADACHGRHLILKHVRAVGSLLVLVGGMVHTTGALKFPKHAS